VSSAVAIDGPVSTAITPIAVAAQRSAPPLTMRKIEKKRFGLNQRGVFIGFLAVSGFRFFILLYFLLLYFGFASAFTYSFGKFCPVLQKSFKILASFAKASAGQGSVEVLKLGRLSQAAFA
jgi:hypothetical protein